MSSKTDLIANEKSGDINGIAKDKQIGNYVIALFEDSDNNLWFGTIANGVAKYDGRELNYFTADDGLEDNRVAAIAEDKQGNLWFGTHAGVVKYDGSTFTNYSEADGLCDDRVSNLLVDKSGLLWVGTWGGVCTFDGDAFKDFPLPDPDVEIPTYQETTIWITELYEDSKGHMWFARDGYGACKYDGQKFTHLTKADGLVANTLRDIQGDAHGNIWFSSRVAERDHPSVDQREGPGGLTKYDGETFGYFPDLAGLHHSDVYEVYLDSKSNIWIGTTEYGVYKYDGQSFKNYGKEQTDSLFPKPVTNILEDRKGNIWLGCAGGLFRLNGDRIVNVTTGGPWP